MISAMLVLKIAGVVFLTLFVINAACQIGSWRIKGFPFGDFVLVLAVGVLIVIFAPRIEATGRMVADALSFAEFEWTAHSRAAREQIKSLKKDADLLMQQAEKIKRGEFQERMKVKIP